MDDIISLDQFHHTPTIDNLCKLGNNHFDTYLFELFSYAGYKVEFSNGTFYLSDNNRVKAIVMVSYATRYDVGSALVTTLEEACDKAFEQDNLDVSGVAITRTKFTEGSFSVAQENSRVLLLNGNQLLRYEQYLQGARLKNAQIPPLSPHFMRLVDYVKPCFEQRPKVLAVTNNRGGVGKSTTALNLAYGLAEKGESVLAIDLDPQANFTEMLGGKVKSLSTSHIGHYFAGNTELAHLIQSTAFPKIKLISGHPDMRKVALSMELWPAMHFNFAYLLRQNTIVQHPLIGERGLDWVIIDTSPDMGFYTQAAITASNYLLAPTIPSYAGNNGIGVMFDTAKNISSLTMQKDHARMVGFVATRYSEDKATTAMKDDFRQLQTFIFDSYRLNFMPVHIPETPKILSSTRELIKNTQEGRSFPLFAKEGEGRKEAGSAYKKLVEEVLKHA